MGKLALVLGCVAAASPNALCGSGFFVTTAGGCHRSRPCGCCPLFPNRGATGIGAV